MKELIFTWRIENFSFSWQTTGERIKSPIFFFNSMQNTAWELSLYPRGYDNSDYLSLKLCKVNEGPEYIGVNVELSCITADTSMRHIFFTSESSTNFRSSRSTVFLEPCFIKRHEVVGRRKELYLPKDILTLRCRMWKDEGDANEFGQIFGSTTLQIERINLFEIIHFEKSVKKTFGIKIESKNKALISVSILLPYGDTINVGINRLGDEKMMFSKCMLSLEDVRTDRKIFEHEICFFGRLNEQEWLLHFTDNLIPSEKDNPDERKCELYCKFVYSTGEEKKVIEKDPTGMKSQFLCNYCDCNPHEYLTEYPTITCDLKNLFDCQDLCDVKLSAQNGSFVAHRVVLCSRSPVFLAMLTATMKENEYGCIEIEDCSADTVAKFLCFIYRDEIIFSNWNELIELYYIADKYQVERLKLLCCSYFLKYIRISNVCELFLLADKHNDHELKLNLNNIIWENDKIVFTSPMWKKFADEKPDLAMEIFRSKYEAKENQKPPETYEELISNCPKIQDDFRSLYESRVASDIIIKTANTSYPAYKAVLGASSVILKDKLKDSSNKSTDFIEIYDLEDDTISEMLFFLHSDTFKNIQWGAALKLYHAAVVYKMPRLWCKISYWLIENLRISNACEFLLLAHEHQDWELVSCVQNYICVYDDEIFQSDKWAEICQVNSRLALETMRQKYR